MVTREKDLKVKSRKVSSKGTKGFIIVVFSNFDEIYTDKKNNFSMFSRAFEDIFAHVANVGSCRHVAIATCPVKNFIYRVLGSQDFAVKISISERLPDFEWHYDQE